MDQYNLQNQAPASPPGIVPGSTAPPPMPAWMPVQQLPQQPSYSQPTPPALPPDMSVTPAPPPVYQAPPLPAPASNATPDTYTGPELAEDNDVIEKAWVNHAKEITSRTRNDPYEQVRELNKLRADYMQKRYNKEIKLPEA